MIIVFQVVLTYSGYQCSRKLFIIDGMCLLFHHLHRLDCHTAILQHCYTHRKKARVKFTDFLEYMQPLARGACYNFSFFQRAGDGHVLRDYTHEFFAGVLVTRGKLYRQDGVQGMHELRKFLHHNTLGDVIKL